MQRPSGASMEAAASMAMVAGSRVTSAAQASARPARPSRSAAAARAMADREEEHAVSMAIAGPAE